MKQLDPRKAIAWAMAATDRSKLQQFREKMVAAGATEVVTAIDRRLDELAMEALRRTIGPLPANLGVVERVHEAVRVLEALRKHNNGGRARPASRTRGMIKRHGEIGAVKQLVMTHKTSQGLEDLAAFGRLDCAFEQIILEFPEAFDDAAAAKARANLARLASGAHGDEKDDDA
jgi:hypothetical protein